jgi:nucleoid-associated protein YgaU
MRRARILLLLMLLLIAGASLAYYGYRNGWEQSGVPGTDAPGQNMPPEQRVQPSKLTRPNFDIVRAEPTGDMVMAGRAEPGWRVSVESGGQVVGSAVADAQGEWVITPDAPVRKGEHSLELKSQSPNGQQMLFSKQRLALSLGTANKGRPLVALTEEGEPTRVLQMAPATQDDKRADISAGKPRSELPNPPLKPDASTALASGDPVAQVTFTSIDYEPNSSNAVFFTGRGIPGARVMLYIDNEFAGTASVDATGGWTFRGSRDLKQGTHALRADHVELATGKVLARAEVNFDREAPSAVALGAASTGSSAAASGSAQPRVKTEVADVQSSTGANPGAKTADATVGTEIDPKVIIVRRGDTLWQIAARNYGNGSKYTQIFQTNKGQIRNPNLIYPSQRFNVPQ